MSYNGSRRESRRRVERSRSRSGSRDKYKKNESKRQRHHSSSSSSSSDSYKRRSSHYKSSSSRREEKYDKNRAEGSSKSETSLNSDLTSGGISIKLAPKIKVASSSSVSSISKPHLQRPTKVASIFNNDESEDEGEEMPPECKMRMKNIGRETPTSAGPNSFGKTKMGFCNMTLITEKLIEERVSCKK